MNKRARKNKKYLFLSLCLSLMAFFQLTSCSNISNSSLESNEENKNSIVTSPVTVPMWNVVAIDNCYDLNNNIVIKAKVAHYLSNIINHPSTISLSATLKVYTYNVKDKNNTGEFFENMEPIYVYENFEDERYDWGIERNHINDKYASFSWESQSGLEIDILLSKDLFIDNEGKIAIYFIEFFNYQYFDYDQNGEKVNLMLDYSYSTGSGLSYYINNNCLFMNQVW